MPFGVNFRNAATSHPTDGPGFVAQTDTTAYSPSRGYGYIDSSGVSTRLRTTSIDPQLCGHHYASGNGYKFRLDLLNGAGKYKLRAAFCDPSTSYRIGVRFFDGDTGVEIAALKKTYSSGNYTTILGNTGSTSQFDRYKEDYIEHDFKSDHVLVVRDSYMQSGSSLISSVWAEPVAGNRR